MVSDLPSLQLLFPFTGNCKFETMEIEQVRKRDGRLVKFDQSKITTAIHRAISAVGGENGKAAKQLSDQVVESLQEKFAGKVPSIENIQDIVEDVLIKNGRTEVAKAYILYRKEHGEVREFKKFFGVFDDLKLGINAVKVLRSRYLRRNEEGNVVETPRQMFRRVAKHVAKADRNYGGGTEKAEKEFYELMTNLEFLPNSPTLMNAGTELGQLSACFVLPVDDSIEQIFDSLKHMALIHQSGGGTGFSFSNIRPRGDIVKSTKGIASGPVSFMRIFNEATEVIKQGGRRRGANIGVLRFDHPDILEFISSKSGQAPLENFNISMAVTDKFIQAVRDGEDYELVNPRIQEATGKLNAKDVFDLAAATAWRTGDPGLIFIDEINRKNPVPGLGKIETSNPCGEVPLLSHGSCNLGSINLYAMIQDGEINWDKLRRTARTAVHFLDNVIDVNNFPLKEIEERTKETRKIGLGVMGFADTLARLRIPYDTEKALKMGEKIMKTIANEARDKSAELGEERGSFPAFDKSIWKDEGYDTLRNATVNSIAPTGTISIIAGVSSSIEPIFAISYIRNVMEGVKLPEVNPEFERVARERGFYDRDLIREIARGGSIQGMEEVPEDIQRLFVTALDIDPEWHVKMQAAFQRHVDNAVAKTVNLPQSASVEDVRDIYLLAHELGCKGITVYRYGSKEDQVLQLGSLGRGKEPEEELVRAESEYSGGCALRECSF